MTIIFPTGLPGCRENLYISPAENCSQIVNNTRYSKHRNVHISWELLKVGRREWRACNVEPCQGEAKSQFLKVYPCSPCSPGLLSWRDRDCELRMNSSRGPWPITGQYSGHVITLNQSEVTRLQSPALKPPEVRHEKCYANRALTLLCILLLRDT